MKQELDEALVRDFPLSFARNPTGKEPWSMFGFECGDGWEPSIRKTAEKLEPLIQAEIEKDPKAYEYGYFRTSQLKEKFGTGRWYLSGGSEEMSKLVEAWEEETASICERCGKPGELRGQGWLYTACLEHTKAYDRDNLEVVEEAYINKEKQNG